MFNRLGSFRIVGLLALGGWLLACSFADEIAASAFAEKPNAKAPSKPLVIAHRGASGYLPEHSEGAKVLAMAQGADILEQDLVLSRDGVFVVSHDITMDHITNVKDIYPDRKREDGHYYFADFDWEELKVLSLRERSLQTGRKSSRFPYKTSTRIMCLEDEVKLIHGLSETLGRSVGFHIELKSPSWHLEQFGEHMSDRLLKELPLLAVSPTRDLCFIQCFEAGELLHLKNELDCPFPLVQLLGGRPLGLVNDAGMDRMQVMKAELAEIAKYADGIGPAIPLLVTVADDSSIRSTGYAEAAQEMGLIVHPYTVRKDMLPEWCESIDELHDFLLSMIKVDGFFTDFPDLGRVAVDRLSSSETSIP